MLRALSAFLATLSRLCTRFRCVHQKNKKERKYGKKKRFKDFTTTLDFHLHDVTVVGKLFSLPCERVRKKKKKFLLVWKILIRDVCREWCKLSIEMFTLTNLIDYDRHFLIEREQFLGRQWWTRRRRKDVSFLSAFRDFFFFFIGKHKKRRKKKSRWNMENEEENSIWLVGDHAQMEHLFSETISFRTVQTHSQEGLPNTIKAFHFISQQRRNFFIRRRPI